MSLCPGAGKGTRRSFSFPGWLATCHVGLLRHNVPMEKPGLVLFDIGNVILSLRPEAFPPGGFARGLVDARRFQEATDAFRNSEVLERIERGQATSEEFSAALRSTFKVSLSDEEIARHYVQILGPEKEGILPL